MDPEDSENKDPLPLRRLTRQSSAKALTFEATPRRPLKRSRPDGGTKTAATATVNGSRHVENESGDGESSEKRIRLQTGGTDGCDNDSNETVVQDSEKNEDTEEMDVDQDSSHVTPQLKKNLDFPQSKAITLEDRDLYPRVMLGKRCILDPMTKEDKDKTVKPSRKPPATPPTSVSHSRELENTFSVPFSVPMPRVTSMVECRRKKVPPKGAGSLSINHGLPNQMRQCGNNIVIQKEVVKPKKEVRKKTGITKRLSGDSSRGWALYVWYFLLLVLLSCSLLLAYKITPLYQRTGASAVYPSRSVSLDTFADLLSQLETQFVSQRPDLWERSKVHLERHLKTAQPKEPVSLILTAGRKAERTLYCLAKSLASAFSSALNASVLHFDGASKAGLGSDEVKLDIDRQLQAAFEQDKPVAVIHRLEELPPGSTIIFYRYCDHENAAYKRVFLLFTVLLSQDEVTGNLKEVEELVQDYVKEKLVGSSNQMAYNEMDADKYSGLWSRISHLILPVVSEREVEQKDCL